VLFAKQIAIWIFNQFYFKLEQSFWAENKTNRILGNKMGNIHPYTVHFTIALFLSSVLFDILGFWRKNTRLHIAAWFNLLLAGVATIFSVISGLWEKRQVPIPQSAQEVLDIHQTSAILIAICILGLAFWRIGSREKLPLNKEPLYLIIAAMGVVFLLTGAYFGGKLVYSYGVGVKTVKVKKQCPFGKIPGNRSFFGNNDRLSV